MQVALMLLVSLLGVKLNLAGSLSSSKNYYDEIDNYLTKAVSSDDVEENMVKAAEWLAELKLKGGFSSRNLIKDLKTLLQLKTVVGEDKCNMETYEILAKNDEKSGYAVSDRVNDQSTRRIHVIVRYYATKHSDICCEVWPQKLADKLQEVTPESMKYVNELTKEKNTPWIHKLEQKRYIELLRDHLKADPKHQQKVADKKYEYQKNLVTLNDYRKYLLHPCRDVKQKVSDVLYKPIKFDMNVYRFRYKWWNDNKREFRYHRGILDWCDHILTHEGPIWDHIYEIMSKEKKSEKSGNGLEEPDY